MGDHDACAVTCILYLAPESLQPRSLTVSSISFSPLSPADALTPGTHCPTAALEDCYEEGLEYSCSLGCSNLLLPTPG